MKTQEISDLVWNMLHVPSCHCAPARQGLRTVISTPSSARIRAAYDEASSAVDIVLWWSVVVDVKVLTLSKGNS